VSKKKFIDRLKKETKENLIEIICKQHEMLYDKKKELEFLTSLNFSHQQCLKFALASQKCNVIYEIEENDEEDIPDNVKESAKSYV
jgi:hypothetical protein